MVNSEETAPARQRRRGERERERKPSERKPGKPSAMAQTASRPVTAWTKPDDPHANDL
jgi:hypothetical protein